MFYFFKLFQMMWPSRPGFTMFGAFAAVLKSDRTRRSCRYNFVNRLISILCCYNILIKHV